MRQTDVTRCQPSKSSPISPIDYSTLLCRSPLCFSCIPVFPPGLFFDYKETMNSRFLSIFLLASTLLLGVVLSFQAPLPQSAVVRRLSDTSLGVFGQKKKKTEAQLEAESLYWEGDWVCKDCKKRSSEPPFACRLSLTNFFLCCVFVFQVVTFTIG